MARLIGPSNLPTGAVASGIWSMMQAQKSVGDFTWPTLLKQSGAALALDFDETTSLDSRITFTRATNGTYFDSSGVLQTASSGAARFDHRLEGGVWVNKGLLIEEQRTNVNQKSEEFNDAYWAKTNLTVTANSVTTPDGTTTADTLTDDATNGGHGLLRGISILPTQVLTFSVFLKKNTLSWARLFIAENAFTDRCTAWFDLDNGSVGTVSNGGTGSGATASIIDVGNGWYRCSITGTPSTTGTSSICSVNCAPSDNTAGYIGTGQSLYAWGAQFEAGAFPTSYIKTTSASVTRNQDVAEMTSTNFSSWYNQSEGTVFLQADRLGPIPSGTFPVILSISNGTQNERMVFNYNSDPDYRFLGIDGNVIQFILEELTSISAGTVGKLCGAYKVNDFAFSADGNSVLTDTSGTLPTPNKVNIGSNYAGNTPSQISGHIAKLYYWNTRKSNSFLQEITS